MLCSCGEPLDAHLQKFCPSCGAPVSSKSRHDDEQSGAIHDSADPPQGEPEPTGSVEQIESELGIADEAPAVEGAPEAGQPSADAPQLVRGNSTEEVEGLAMLRRGCVAFTSRMLVRKRPAMFVLGADGLLRWEWAGLAATCEAASMAAIRLNAVEVRDRALRLRGTRVPPAGGRPFSIERSLERLLPREEVLT